MPYHSTFRVRETRRRKELQQKNNNHAMKKYVNSLEYIKENAYWKFKLKSTSCTDDFNEMRTTHLMPIKLTLLQSLVKTRLVEDL